MSSQIWPTSLPTVPRRDGFQETPPNLTLRTQTDSGISKVRKRVSVGVRQVVANYYMTRTQVQTLDDFYALVGGHTSFDWVHPRTQVAVVARFTEPPVITPGPAEGAWPVSIKLEILP